MSIDTTKQTKKAIADWSSDEVVEWIKQEYAGRESRIKKLVNVIKENGYTGEELLSCANVDELQDALGINKILAKDLYNKMIGVKTRIINDIVNNATKKSVNTEKTMTPEELNYLIEILEGLFPVKREYESKENESKESDDGNIFAQFIKIIQETGASTKSFVKSLIGLTIKQSITERIIGICFDYYRLLKKTANDFTAYGKDIHKLKDTMSQISYHFLLPASIKGELDKLDNISKQKAINALRKQTSKGLTSSCKRFHTLLNDIDKNHVPVLKTLSKEWLALKERIMGLLAVLKNYDMNKNEENKNVNGTLTTLGRVAKVAGGFCLKYIGIPATVDKGDKMIQEVATAIDHEKLIQQNKEEIRRISILKDALSRMAILSEHMSTVICLEVRNFGKIQEYNPHNTIVNNGGGCGEFDVMTMNDDILKKVHELGKSILNCSNYLEKSRKNIQIIEDLCESEMNQFGVYVQKPLIQMLTEKKNIK